MRITSRPLGLLLAGVVMLPSCLGPGKEPPSNAGPSTTAPTSGPTTGTILVTSDPSTSTSTDVESSTTSTPELPPVTTSASPAVTPTAVDPWTPGVCTRPAGLPKALDPELKRRWDLAKADASRLKYPLTLVSGWRDWDAQASLYAAEVRKKGTPAAARSLALPPQESSHVWGLAIDAGNEFAARWLLTQGWRYGLCAPYANEWWHFEKGRVGKACPAPLPSPAALPKKPCP